MGARHLLIASLAVLLGGGQLAHAKGRFDETIERATAISTQAVNSRAPFRSLVLAAWRVSAPR